MSEASSSIIDVKATAAAMQADAAAPTEGAHLPPLQTPPAPPEGAAPAPAGGPSRIGGRFAPKPGGPKRGRGRPRKTPPADGSTAAPPSSSPIAPQGERRQLNPYESAALLNGIGFGIVKMIAGEEAQPTPDEATMCNGTLGEYLEMHPDLVIRPELLLVAVYLPYLGRAFTRPTARERLKFAWSATLGRIGRGIKSIFTKKPKEPVNAPVAVQSTN